MEQSRRQVRLEEQAIRRRGQEACAEALESAKLAAALELEEQLNHLSKRSVEVSSLSAAFEMKPQASQKLSAAFEMKPSKLGYWPLTQVCVVAVCRCHGIIVCNWQLE